MGTETDTQEEDFKEETLEDMFSSLEVKDDDSSKSKTSEKEEVEEGEQEEEESKGEEGDETPSSKKKGSDEEEEKVPMAALLDERRKRQELERQLQEERKGKGGKTGEEGDEKLPDFYSDPQGAYKYIEGKINQARVQERITISREFMMDKHEDYEEKEKVFVDLCKQDSTLAQKMVNSPNPARFVYQTVNKHLADQELEAAGGPDKLREKIREEERAKLMKEMGIKDEKGGKGKQEVEETDGKGKQSESEDGEDEEKDKSTKRNRRTAVSLACKGGKGSSAEPSYDDSLEDIFPS